MPLFRVLRRTIGLSLLVIATSLQAAEPRLSVFPREVRLLTDRARQLLITRHSAEATSQDATRDVSFTSDDPSIAEVDAAGVIRPRRQGTTAVRVIDEGKGTRISADVMVIVGDLAKSPRVSFGADVMAVLGKAGCNTGACHGHNSGKGGFKLSLRGYDPASDVQALSRDQAGRRINRLAPDESLLLLKPTAAVAHGGERRFAVGSAFHSILKKWIAEGAGGDVGAAPRVERLEVQPEECLMPRRGMSQQIVVTAHLSDGTARDVTDQAIYELSAEGVVEVRPDGLVTGKREGEAAVLVRFLGTMGLSRYLVVRHQADFAWIEPAANNFVDTHIWAKLKAIQAAPSELCSDAEFLRRASLDVTGLLPEPDEVRAFLADTSPRKRTAKIDELLDRDAFGDFWASRWMEISGVTESGDSAATKGVWTLSLWLRDALNHNMRYDRFAKSLIAANGGSLQNPAVTFTVNRLPKVETIPQLFLGVRLECAQCHDHPFDVWKQSDYQALQSFFLDLGTKEGAGDPRGREIRNFVPPERFLPWEAGKTVALRLLDGSTVHAPVQRNRREVLAEWMFGPAKKQAARALVNRTWGKLFGRGIVEPVDDMRFSNPPVNGPLLDALADDFIASGYDFKLLVRTLLGSRTYQLSSKPNATNASEEMNFSHARMRRLSAEQLLDAISQVTGVAEESRIVPPGFRAAQIPFEYGGSRFLSMFGRPNLRMSPCECIRSQEITLPQVLHILNGDTIARRLRAEGGTLSRMLAAKPSDTHLIEEVYLTTLSRFPSAGELKLAETLFRESGDQAVAAEDLMWALLTSQEFLFNH